MVRSMEADIQISNVKYSLTYVYGIGSCNTIETQQLLNSETYLSRSSIPANQTEDAIRREARCNLKLNATFVEVNLKHQTFDGNRPYQWYPSPSWGFLSVSDW